MDELNENTIDENIEENEVIEDDSDRGIGGKIALGVGLLAVAGAAGAAFVAKKKGKLDEIKAKHDAMKAEKLEKKAEMLRNRYVVVETVKSDNDEE